MIKKILVEIQLSDDSLFAVDNCVTAIADAVHHVTKQTASVDPNFYVFVSEIIDIDEQLAAEKGEK
jgi:hypothetical protein